jgi:lipoate-protein ligase A
MVGPLSPRENPVSMLLATEAHPSDPALDMAFTAALLEAVARGRAPETVRLYRPAATVAFGRSDRARPGLAAACEAARAHGRTPLLRLGGGHAAAYDADCILVEVIRSHAPGAGGLEERFADAAQMLKRALASAGVQAERGELPGEYCPGRFSLHLPGGPKIAGVAQRVVSGGSLTTAVLVVGGGDALRAAIADVYAALDLAVDPRVAGAVSDGHPLISVAAVLAAMDGIARERYGALPGAVDDAVTARARELVPTVSL